MLARPGKANLKLQLNKLDPNTIYFGSVRFFRDDESIGSPLELMITTKVHAATPILNFALVIARTSSNNNSFFLS
jgi:hypothetical protein